MPLGATPRAQATTSSWWYHTDLTTKKRWFGEPFGGPDTEIARPFYVANLEKKIRETGEAASDLAPRMTAGCGPARTREQHVGIIDALANTVGGRFQITWPNRGVIDELP